jgi:hypothetical protein
VPNSEARRGALIGIIRSVVESSIAPLMVLFERERSAGRALVLGIVLETAG